MERSLHFASPVDNFIKSRRRSLKMERIMEATFESNLALVSLLLGNIKYPEIVDAVICLPGEEENNRQEFAKILVSKFREKKPGTLFLVAGFGPNHKGYGIEDAIQQGVAENTLDQAVWVVEKMSKLHIRKAVIVTAIYHMLRGYATVLRQLEKNGFSASLFPAPVLHSNIFFEENRMQAEIERIKAYQGKGDVTSLEGLLLYLNRFYT